MSTSVSSFFCQLPDSGFEFRVLVVAVVATTSVIQSACKDIGNEESWYFLQCFLLWYGSSTTLQDSPAGLPIVQVVLGAGATVYIYTHMYIDIYIHKYGTSYMYLNHKTV